VCLIGPAGTGKSHILVALGHAAVGAGHKVRYFTAAELVKTPWRGMADNSVARVIDTLLRNALVLVDELAFAPLDDTGARLLFPFIAAEAGARAYLATWRTAHPSADDGGRLVLRGQPGPVIDTARSWPGELIDLE
jgi:DNA replication protein DnaC